MRCGLLILFAVSVTTGPVAQEPPVRRPFREAATVPADTTVAKSLGQVEEFAAAGRWQDALEILQQLTETHSAALTQIRAGEAGGTAWYANVATRANILLARLPADARADYRARLDPLAREWFAEWEVTRREAALQRILRTAFLSSYGDDALWALGEAAWDRGEFATARRLWTQLVPLPAEVTDDRFPGVLRYPDTDLDLAGVRARLILCSLMLKEPERARREIDRFAIEFPQAEGKLGGQTGSLIELLRQMSESLGLPQPLPWSGDFATFGGSMSRQWIAGELPDLATPTWSAELRRNSLPLWFRQVLQRDGGPLAYHPVIWRDLVLVADEGSISAWNLLTGEPAWSTEGNLRPEIYPAVPEDRESTPDRPSLGLPHYTLTIDDGRLYARMGWPVTSPSRRELRPLISTLVCLNLEQGQGQLEWMVSSEELPADGGPPWSWEGTPVVEQGRVFAVACRRRPQLELAVVCVEPAEGRVEWMRPVCTGRPQAEEDFNRISHLLLSAAEGRLFLSTDAGVILSLDATDGRLDWAVTYETATEPGGFRQSMPGFSLLPCVVHDGRVYAAPNDSDRILCLEAATGRTIWNQAMPERIRSLLGVGHALTHDVLITSGRSLWAFDVRTGKPVWRDHSDERGYGEGVLCGEQVLWPTREALLIFDQATGQLRRRIELDNPDAPGTGGNLAVAPGWIVVAEPTRLVVYWEYSGQRRKLLEGLSQEPYDHRLRLRLAELDAARGDMNAAKAEWTRVLEIADRNSNADIRQETEAAWLSWAGRWSGKSAEEGQAELAVNPLRDVLEQLSTPELQEAAHYRLALSEIQRGASGDPLTPLVSLLKGRRPTTENTRQLLRRILTDGADSIRERYAVEAGADWHFSPTAARTAIEHGASASERREIRTALATLESVADWPVSNDLQDQARRTAHMLEQRLQKSNELETSRPDASPWWQLSWERLLHSGEKVVVPQVAKAGADPSVLLLVNDRITAVRTNDNRALWTRVLGEPLLRVLATSDSLVLIQPQTLQAVDLWTGEAVWQRPSVDPSGSTRAQAGIGFDSEVLVLRADDGTFVARDVRTGEQRWRTRPPAGQLQLRWTLAEGRLWCQTLNPAHTWCCDLKSGAWEPPRYGLDRPWRSAPCVDASLMLGVVGDARAIHAIPAGESLSDRRFAGPLSQAHADPMLRTDGRRWWAIVDGLSISRFEPQSGIPSGSAALTSWPNRGLPGEVAWGRERAWCATDGVLRGALLENPAEVCELPLGDDRRWCVAFVPAIDDSAAGAIWVWPANGAAEVIVVNERDGRLRQRLPLSGDSGLEQVVSTVSGPVLVTERSLRLYAPIPRVTTAAAR
ncbi:PQQ-binding-like beta-propeller repeat protein [Planctellipticum variicoloris]|uniref:PQQ-binding-like beta-propeller repeat protein n=1 Tax=Planctellipticum variicoloris TaxID=3064265 RepID=UPI0030134A69|nr:PQQ-binding-like beta-propeller repeat protein [Planctomycetaceae bacterium SH412]